VTFLLRRLHGAADFKRYTRCPRLWNDRILRPCFRRVREMKLRRVWDCHPAALRAAMTGRDRCAEKKAVLSLGVNQPVNTGNILRLNSYCAQGPLSDHKAITWQPTHQPRNTFLKLSAASS
jgi:hypothetical protein